MGDPVFHEPRSNVWIGVEIRDGIVSLMDPIFLHFLRNDDAALTWDK